jgi:hypothetical protein
LKLEKYSICLRYSSHKIYNKFNNIKKKIFSPKLKKESPIKRKIGTHTQNISAILIIKNLDLFKFKLRMNNNNTDTEDIKNI